MFTDDELFLLDRIGKSNFYGAVAFASNVREQGFMSAKQKIALINMDNSIRASHSRKYRSRRPDKWDHDDLAEGWDGY